MQWINTLLDPTFVISTLSAVAAFATIVSLTMPLLTTDKLSRRLKGVSKRREELKARAREDAARRNRVEAGSPVDYMRRVIEELNLRELMENRQTKIKLTQAGFRGPAPLIIFLFFKLAMPVIVAVGCAFYLLVISTHPMDPLLKIVTSIAVGAIGSFLPNLYITNITQKRQTAMMKAFPDALDLLLICVESGMSIEAAFQRVSQEIGVGSIELAEEFGLTTAELSYLGDRSLALENLALRTGLPAVKAVVTALVQAERYGTPLGHSLRVMAQEFRDERMSLAEKKAAALPAKLTVPMIVFFLPVLFVVILGPAALQVMLL